MCGIGTLRNKIRALQFGHSTLRSGKGSPAGSVNTPTAPSREGQFNAQKCKNVDQERKHSNATRAVATTAKMFEIMNLRKDVCLCH
jgi:hypothetical protein